MVSQYLWSTLQQLRLNSDDSQTSTTNRSSLMRLPDDILLIIYDMLHDEIRDPHWPPHWTQRKSCPVCLVSLSMANRRMRALAGPKIHKVVHLGPSWGTERMHSAVEAIRRSEAVRQHARELRVDYWTAPWARGAPEMEFAHDLVQVLPTLSGLKKLCVTVTESSAHALQTVFSDMNPAFPSITELVLSPYMEWIIRLCPDVRSVSTNDWILMAAAGYRHELAFISAAGKAKKLEHFSLHCRWNKQLIAEAAPLLPNLKSLALTGDANLAELLPLLQRFRTLQRLRLAHAESLYTAALKTPALELARRETQTNRLPLSSQLEGSEASDEEVVARMTFRSLPNLSQLLLGIDCAVIAGPSPEADPPGMATKGTSRTTIDINIGAAPLRLHIYCRPVRSN